MFKDKGGDRKQKQDQQKIEKLSPSERVSSQSVCYPSYITMVTTVAVPALSGSLSVFTGTTSSHNRGGIISSLH